MVPNMATTFIVIGTTISHYSILEKLGEGGMGVIYKPRDTHLGRFVAIRVLPPEKVGYAERTRRFVQEAKAASSLNHPNIVTIYDIEQVEHVDSISKECVSGNTLDRLIPRHGMRLNEALSTLSRLPMYSLGRTPLVSSIGTSSRETSW